MSPSFWYYFRLDAMARHRGAPGASAGLAVKVDPYGGCSWTRGSAELVRWSKLCQKDSCNLMWTAVRPRSTELKLQNMELKQEHFRK